MSAREEILSNIRRSLRVNGAEGPRRSAVDSRLSGAPRGVVPARGQLDRRGRIELFKQMANAAFASVAIVNDAAEVPGEAARWLRDNNLPATLRKGEDLRLAAMPWQETALDMSAGRSDGHDLNAVSHAFAGVAESGTLVMTSGPDNPSTLNFLPDNHIVVVSADDLEGDYESVFDRVRARFGKGLMPRTVNFITGPSRSADIAQTMLLGAHGPRKLHIVIVDQA
ncbi:MAG: lactate utilization protein [Beijerinckiaceae bacterium]